MGSGPVIEMQQVSKRFGRTEALTGLDLEVARGSVVAMLGPNGAGKTTAVRVLATLVVPDGGTARVAGFDVRRHAAEVRRRIGLTGQYAALDDYLTGRGNLIMIGELCRLGRAEAVRRADALLARFELTDAAGRNVKTYSGGMRRRLDLAAGLMSRPEVLFLDEPTTGLDPRSRIVMWEVIRGLVAEGTTLLLTTQYLEEADQVADRIVVVDHGRAIAEGTSAELKALVGGERLEITVSHAGEVAAAVSAVAPLGAAAPTADPALRLVRLPVRGGAALLPAVVRALDGAGVTVEDLAVRLPTLDDVFLSLTGRAQDEATDAAAQGARA
jgi:ABC-2 type transport system ATP-binding protein